MLIEGWNAILQTKLPLSSRIDGVWLCIASKETIIFSMFYIILYKDEFNDIVYVVKIRIRIGQSNRNIIAVDIYARTSMKGMLIYNFLNTSRNIENYLSSLCFSNL